MSHTPGPWVFDPKNVGRNFNHGIGVYQDAPDGGWTVAHVPLRGDCYEADARLIAAAPELLALLKEGERLYRAHALVASPAILDDPLAAGRWANAVVDAIAKAEGRS